MALAAAVVNKAVQQVEIMNLPCAADMGSRTGAGVEMVADEHMMLVLISNGKILLNQLMNLENLI